MKRIPLRMWAAYLEEPIMIKDGDIFRHCDIKELNVSESLRQDIQAWDREYQDTFDSEYPPESSFASLDIEKAHAKTGAKLAERLQVELAGDYSIEYRIA